MPRGKVQRTLGRFASRRLVALAATFGAVIAIGSLGCGSILVTAGFLGAQADDLRADAGLTPLTFGTDGAASTAVILNGTASTAPGSIVSYKWMIDGALSATGPLATVDLPLGEHVVILEIIDDRGRSAQDTISLSVTAATPEEVSLTVSSSGEGETWPAAGLTTYPTNTAVTLRALPGEGSWFAGWTGDVDTAEPTTTIVMDKNKLVQAEFLPFEDGGVRRLNLPWSVDAAYRVSQGNLGDGSHEDRFAWDFAMPLGTPILAGKGGRVVSTSDPGLHYVLGLTEFEDPSAFVTVDHGDGLIGVYGSIDEERPAVVPGQWVVRGQVLGYSADSGFSGRPHAHFEVTDPLGGTISTGFEEVNRADSIAVEGDVLTSRNTLDEAPTENSTASLLAPDAFAINDIELTGEMPPALFFETECDYEVGGRVLNDRQQVCVALVDPDSFEVAMCDLIPVEEDGTFTIPFSFPPEMVGHYWWGVISGDDGAEGVVPVYAWISEPLETAADPVALIDPPDDPSIDFLGSGVLSGSGSFSSLGRPLTYQWAQVSGPPATIADPTAAETEFTIELGAGTSRVSFQLVVFDGVRYSLPDEVDFLMPDTFFVSRVGIADTMCPSPDSCPLFDPPPALVSFSTGTIVGWLELVGVELGDVLTFTVADPDGEIIGTSEVAIITEPESISFWRLALGSTDLELTPGPWTGTFARNGFPIATVEFRAMP